MSPTIRRSAAVALAAWIVLGCSSSGDTEVASTTSSPAAQASPAEALTYAFDALDAIAAVDEALGAPQEFFEVTANARFTNVFVAVDDSTAAVAYLFVDGELQPPSPKQPGAEGKTFTAADVDYDPSLVLNGVAEELPTSQVDAISVYGNGFGAVYVVATTSPSGGFLDVEVGPAGQVLAVDPV